MDRRDALQRLTGITAMIGIGSHAKVIDAEPRPALIVLECEGGLSENDAAHIKAYFEQTLAGTPLEGVRCAVLANGLTLKVLTDRGVS